MIDIPDNIVLTPDSYAETVLGGVYREDFERGISKQRPMKCALPIVINCKFVTCNKNDFYNWFKDDLAHGSMWFRFLDPTTGDYLRARFQNHTIQLTAIDERAQQFEFSASLEILK